MHITQRHPLYSVHATAVHPGYGFLSESTELADKCKQSGILFIGPSASCIAAVGDKVSARQVAKAAGVPVIPGTEESISTPEQVFAFADRFGYPVMLKARDGGGGRGIRMVHHADEVSDSLKRCINESPSKQVFIEKAVIGAKHIEVQILGDNHGNVIHLFERDCSIQRRYQKILEVSFFFFFVCMNESVIPTCFCADCTLPFLVTAITRQYPSSSHSVGQAHSVQLCGHCRVPCSSGCQ